MTDRELLELSANATGHKWKWVACNTPGFSEVPGMLLVDHAHEVDYWPRWNPLTDDGDALRLAVKLDIRVTPDPEMARCECWYGPLTRDWLFEVWGEDKQAATRRAITRAAAEIGKTSP